MFLRLYRLFCTSRKNKWQPHSTQRLKFRRDAYAERCSSVLCHEEVKKPKPGSLMHPICITRQFESRQKAENTFSVKWIDYLGLHLHLQVLEQFSNASSEIETIVRRVMHQAIYSVVQRFPEAVINCAYYRKLFIAIRSGFFVTANQQISVRSGVFWSTVLDMCFTRRLFVFLRLRLWVGIVFFRRFWQGWVSLHVFASSLTVATFWAAIRWLLAGYSLTPGSGPPWQ